MADPKTYFGLSCPNGGQFYICENITTEFIGCCTTNPCTSPDSGKCPTANLRAASFSAGKYFALKQQDCDDAASIKIWYTCADIIPPFMGCCGSNPCAAGLCTPTDLRPAKLSSEPGRRASFLHPGGTDPSTTTSSSSATSTATNTAPTSTTSSTNLSGGAIGGICAAATVVLIMIVGIAIWYTRKKGQERAAPTPADVPTGKPLPFFGDNGYRPRGESNVSGATAFADGMSSHNQQSPPLGWQYPSGFDPRDGRERETSFSQDVAFRPAPKIPAELPPDQAPIPELPAL